jgi:Raf kinase inhibitor-like YbhB/YbcL family protein
MLEKLPDTVGRVLHHQRAGLDEIAFHLIRAKLPAGAAMIDVHSPAFDDGASIPLQYTADGAGISPPLQWTDVPPQAAALVLLVEDADAPTSHPLVHAIVVDLPPHNGGLPEGALDSAHHAGIHVNAGRNSWLKANWLPPDPPPGHGVHRYAFQLFALSAGPAFPKAPGRELVLDTLRERTIASGYLIGTYQRD